MKFSRQLACGSLAVFMLTACSENALERRQAKDDFTYLDATALKEWTIPADATPQFYPNYDIPAGPFQGQVGGNVDIRPPMQVLEILSGVRIEPGVNSVTYLMANKDIADQFWSVIVQRVTESGVIGAEQSATKLESNWIDLQKDEDESSDKYRAKYRFSRGNKGSLAGIKIDFVELQNPSGEVETSSFLQQRYIALLSNQLNIRYDDIKRAELARIALESAKHIDVNMGTDRSGLPIIIARASYDIFWQKLPDLITKAGFSIEDRNQSQGTIDVKFNNPGDKVWQELSVAPLTLDEASYTIMLGDLGSRTSLNITNSKGKPLPQETLEALVPVIQAINKFNNK
jgi:outer membrane protein assembly factor BamC